MSREQKEPPFAATAYVVAVSVIAIFFGAVGLVSGEFWIPSRAKRAVSGPLGRFLGGIFLVAGTAGLILAIIGACGGEAGRPMPRRAKSTRRARGSLTRQSQANERAVAEYLGLEDDGVRPVEGGHASLKEHSSPSVTERCRKN